MGELQRFIGTGFYSGLLPKAPGTWGTLAFWPFAFLIAKYDAFFLTLAVSAVMIALHPWSYKWFKKNLGDDPGCFVLDEWVGIQLAFFLIPFPALSTFGLISVGVAGFVLFRLFDIAKPLFINEIQELPGWVGVLMDDVLAGIYTNICLKLLIFVVFI